MKKREAICLRNYLLKSILLSQGKYFYHIIKKILVLKAYELLPNLAVRL